MKSKKMAIAIAAWVPWITDSYAIGRVVEKLGGPDARFNYLGEDIAEKKCPRRCIDCRFVDLSLLQAREAGLSPSGAVLSERAAPKKW